MNFIGKIFKRSTRPPPSPLHRVNNDIDSDDEGVSSSTKINGIVSPAPVRAGLDMDSNHSLRPAAHRHVRRACDMRRSNTAIDKAALDAARSSASSNSDGANEDPLQAGYRRLRQKYRGRNCIILEGTDRHTGNPVMIRVFSKRSMSASRRERVDREVSLLSTVSGCQYVVKFLASFEDDDNVYTVLEACPGQTMIELMACNGGRLSEGRLASDIIKPLLRAVSYMHSKGVVHRHIKPEHIMYSSTTIKVLDFLDAADKMNQCLNHRVGQLEYMAPEMLNKPRAEDIFHQVLFMGMAEEDLPQYDEKVDVWSIGCVVYEALTGQQPFLADNAPDLSRIQQQQCSRLAPSGIPEFIACHHMSPLAESFLVQALQLDPNNRASVDILMRHAWLSA
mmetsp:Transcript_34425/g.76487  ORF Transcript_34425/g.76487 Transcript_34425/m.76487 type:complete len:393 (+) Transcript_34425:603-1781(+)|eukprot:CAMPEP_0202903340 /NCGR_PEP_ID=MMETSP1392-20130828/23927_1 /ASSEMBLY_ACC=CAM_ASM_000868 /TAXON_ID=225041 /ORGANISM="Chlamydomonas chlamydogama, Strain SAG 11-48b" /LENGTH=392 /DNA_ID=CAMNT_0049590469 /DNA_START=564 /DNA_END=1742 /DNA_ORIENTATION=+